MKRYVFISCDDTTEETNVTVSTQDGIEHSFCFKNTTAALRAIVTAFQGGEHEDKRTDLMARCLDLAPWE